MVYKIIYVYQVGITFCADCIYTFKYLFNFNTVDIIIIIILISSIMFDFSV